MNPENTWDAKPCPLFVSQSRLPKWTHPNKAKNHIILKWKCRLSFLSASKFTRNVVVSSSNQFWRFHGTQKNWGELQFSGTSIRNIRIPVLFWSQFLSLQHDYFIEQRHTRCCDNHEERKNIYCKYDLPGSVSIQLVSQPWRLSRVTT